MRRFLVAVNLLALVASLAGLVYVRTLVPMHSGIRVTELDRHGVINETQLSEYSPWLGENPRHNLSAWIEEPMKTQAQFYASCIGVLALLNVVCLMLFPRDFGRRPDTCEKP